jgi:hypothetical protein
MWCGWCQHLEDDIVVLADSPQGYRLVETTNLQIKMNDMDKWCQQN